MRSLIVLSLLAVVAPAHADGPRRRERTAQADKADKAEKKRAKLKKKIRTMRAIVLAEELDLDEATAEKLFPILNKYDDEFTRLAKEALDLRKKINDASDSNDDDLDDLVDDLMDNQRARWDLDEDRFKAVRKVLTAKQAARILVVLPEIDRKILQGARKALAGKAGKKGKKGKRGKRGKQQAQPADDSDVMDPFGQE